MAARSAATASMSAMPKPALQLSAPEEKAAANKVRVEERGDEGTAKASAAPTNRSSTQDVKRTCWPKRSRSATDGDRSQGSGGLPPRRPPTPGEGALEPKGPSPQQCPGGHNQGLEPKWLRISLSLSLSLTLTLSLSARGGLRAGGWGPRRALPAWPRLGGA